MRTALLPVSPLSSSILSKPSGFLGPPGSTDNGFKVFHDSCARSIILRDYWGASGCKIETARFEIDNLVREATFLTHPVVMPGELVRLRLPWNSNEMGDAKWGHDLTKGDGRLRLSFSYTEVDGHNRIEGCLSLPSIATRRRNRNMEGATIEVLALEEAAELRGPQHGKKG